MDTKTLFEESRKRLDAMDKTEGPLVSQPPVMQLRSVLFALEAGINTQSWNCAADAYLMLEDFLNAANAR